MATRQLSIEYPVALPDVLQETPEQFEQEARMAMAAKLFELKRTELTDENGMFFTDENQTDRATVQGLIECNSLTR